MNTRFKQKICLPLFVILCFGIFVSGVPAASASPDVTGKWYGSWELNEVAGYTSNFSITFVDVPSQGLFAIMYVPELGLFETPLPATVYEDPPASGNYAIAIGFPGAIELSGILDGDSISGSFYENIYLGVTGIWQTQKTPGEDVILGEAPGPQCENLPPPYCNGGAEYCSELVPLEPRVGVGYVDYPSYPETDANRYFSYLRRDLMQLVKYATAKVACKTADWDYGNFSPMGLNDMSEEDGSTPGINHPPLRHPPGTHEFGLDIDTSYYQLFTDDNLGRPVCVHYDGVSNAGHCVEAPYGLDKWRQALYITYLAEHPRVRVIGVDGQVGLVMENALDDLVASGWIDLELRESIPLAYEVENTGKGWFYYHHHHMHTSMNWLYDIVASTELAPHTLNIKSHGNFVTAHIELYEGINADRIDIDSIAMILGGRSLLYTESGRSEISDYNQNGIADLTVKFDRQRVIELIDPGRVEISIIGTVDGQYFFQDSDTIQILGTQNKVSTLESKYPHVTPYARPGNRDIWD